MKSLFTIRVIEIIQAIPRGRVSTYGTIAIHAESNSGARQVARILHSSSRKYNLPWHRVVNREGRISLKRGAGYEIQERLLIQEGVVFSEQGVIDLDIYLWWPGSDIVLKPQEFRT